MIHDFQNVQCRHAFCNEVYEVVKGKRRYSCFSEHRSAARCLYNTKHRRIVRVFRHTPQPKHKPEVFSFRYTHRFEKGPPGFSGWPQPFNRADDAFESVYGNELWSGSVCEANHYRHDAPHGDYPKQCVALLHQIRPWMLVTIAIRVLADIAREVGPAGRNAIMLLLDATTRPAKCETYIRNEGSRLLHNNPESHPANALGLVLTHASPLFANASPKFATSVLPTLSEFFRVAKLHFPQQIETFRKQARGWSVFRAKHAPRIERGKTLTRLMTRLGYHPHAEVALTGNISRWPSDAREYEHVASLLMTYEPTQYFRHIATKLAPGVPRGTMIEDADASRCVDWNQGPVEASDESNDG